MSVLKFFQIAVLGLSASVAFSDSDLSKALKEKAALESEKTSIIALENAVSTFIREYRTYSQSYQDMFMEFQPKIAELNRQAQKAKDEIAKLGTWLQGLSVRLDQQKTTDDLLILRDEYRKEREQNTVCSLSSLDSASRDFANAYRSLYDSYSKLKNLIDTSRLPDSHRGITEQARQGFQAIERSFVEASSVALQYRNAGVRPKTCDDFYQFDIVLSLATTISEINDTAGALDKISLKGFLAEMDNLQKAKNFLKDSRRLTTSAEAQAFVVLRGHDLRRSLEIEKEINSQMIFIKARTDESDLISREEKKDIADIVDRAMQSVQIEVGKLNLKTHAGQRIMLLSRARSIQSRLVDASSKNLGTDKRQLLNIAIESAKKDLGLTMTTRVKLPPTFTTEENLVLNDKMATIEQTLKKVEG
jgi:hypothetical protein